MSESRKRRGWLLAGLAVALAAVLAVAGVATRAARSQGEADRKGLDAPPPGVAVTVERVTARPVKQTVRAVGTLYGYEEVTISAKVEGRALKAHRDVGDVVRPGETLLELDPIDYELAVREARCSLELELAKLGLEKLPGSEFSPDDLPSVKRALANQRNASSRRGIYARLANGAASAEDRNAVERDFYVAAADLALARFEARATRAAARLRAAALDTALQKVKDARVTAPGELTAGPVPVRVLEGGLKLPMEYVVCQRSVAEGDMVRIFMMPNTPGMNPSLFKLALDRVLKLQAQVPERHRAVVRKGQAVEVEVEAYPGRTFRGVVSRIAPMVDRASRSFQVEVLVPNPKRELSPGNFARAVLAVGTDGAARTVPEEAVVSFAGTTKVFVVRGDVAHAVRVRLGATIEVEGLRGRRAWVVVVGDVPAGALVVTSGATQLADGTPVRVRREEGRAR